MFNIKSILIILCLPLCFWTFDIPDELKDTVKRLHNYCQKDTEVPEDVIAQSKNGILVNNSKLKCYIKCLLQQSMVMDKNGHINFEDIYHLLPTEVKEIVENITKNCKNIHGADLCETAYLTVKCYFEADPEVIKNILFKID